MSDISAANIDAEALIRWVEQHVEGFRGPATVARLSGGQSNPTYRMDAASGIYAVRRKPFGPLLPSAHAVDREFRLLSGLHPTGPAGPLRG